MVILFPQPPQSGNYKSVPLCLLADRLLTVVFGPLKTVAHDYLGIFEGRICAQNQYREKIIFVAWILEVTNGVSHTVTLIHTMELDSVTRKGINSFSIFFLCMAVALLGTWELKNHQGFLHQVLRVHSMLREWRPMCEVKI